jgi:hypothetical protein
VRRSQDRRGTTVVTSDLEVAEAVERLGARVRSASDFAAELSRPAAVDDEKGNVASSPEDIDYWQSVFGVEDDDEHPPGATNDFVAIYGDSE